MTPTPELNKAMIVALNEMPSLGFDSKNDFIGNSFVSLGQVIAKTRPILFKHGLAISQVPIDKDGRIGLRTTIRHTSGETDVSEVTMEAPPEKGKSGAQVTGSIITYLRRYAWSAVCGLYVDEDTDGNAPKTSTMATRSVPEPPRQQSSPKEEKPLKSTYSPKETESEKKARIARLDAWLVRCKAQLILELAEKERVANEYAQKHGLCLPNETIADVEVGKLFPSVNMDGTVESNKESVAKDFTTLSKAIEAFGSGGEPPPGPIGNVPGNESFWDIIVTVPPRGKKKPDYIKAPDTIRSLYDQRHGTDEASQLARQRLFGLLNEWEPKSWTGHDGKQRPPSQSDVQFRKALDVFGEWLERNGEKL